MECSDVKEKVVNILNANLGINLDHYDPDALLLDGTLQFDSLTVLQTLVELEAEFDIELYDDELSYESFQTLNNVIQIVMNHLDQN